MSFHDLFIADADTPGYQWEEGSYDGNIPCPQIDLGGIGLWGMLKAMEILKKKYGGKQLDWGACGARMDRRQIHEFFEEFYEDKKKLAAAKIKAQSLKDGKIYLLYACET